MVRVTPGSDDCTTTTTALKELPSQMPEFTVTVAITSCPPQAGQPGDPNARVHVGVHVLYSSIYVHKNQTWTSCARFCAVLLILAMSERATRGSAGGAALVAGSRRHARMPAIDASLRE